MCNQEIFDVQNCRLVECSVMDDVQMLESTFPFGFQMALQPDRNVCRFTDIGRLVILDKIDDRPFDSE